MIDGVELVEALIAAMPGPSADRPLFYRITSAIVDWPCPGTITVEVRSECGVTEWRREIGKPHDVTIDLEDLMVGKAPKGIRTALETALKKIDGARSIPG